MSICMLHARSSFFDAFHSVSCSQGVVTVDFANDGSLRIVSGLNKFTLLKLTQSGWSEFIRDEFTALPETTERLLASSMDIEWEFDLEKLRGLAAKYNAGAAGAAAGGCGGEGHSGVIVGARVEIPENISSRVPMGQLEKVLAGPETAPDFDTSEVIPPRPITPTFGCAKETHPHNVGSWPHDVRRDVSW